MHCCGICLEQGFAWIIVPCNVHICASPLPVLRGTRAPLWRRVCVPGCSGQQKPSAWGKEGCSDKNKAAEIRGRLLQGCAAASGFVHLFCALTSHPSAILPKQHPPVRKNSGLGLLQSSLLYLRSVMPPVTAADWHSVAQNYVQDGSNHWGWSLDSALGAFHWKGFPLLLERSFCKSLIKQMSYSDISLSPKRAGVLEKPSSCRLKLSDI